MCRARRRTPKVKARRGGWRRQSRRSLDKDGHRGNCSPKRTTVTGFRSGGQAENLVLIHRKTQSVPMGKTTGGYEEKYEVSNDEDQQENIDEKRDRKRADDRGTRTANMAHDALKTVETTGVEQPRQDRDKQCSPGVPMMWAGTLSMIIEAHQPRTDRSRPAACKLTSSSDHRVIRRRPLRSFGP
jgi:hypothetical protein